MRPVIKLVSDSFLSTDSIDETSETTELILLSDEIDSDIIKFICSDAKRVRMFSRRISPVVMHDLDSENRVKLSSDKKIDRKEIHRRFYEAYDEFEKQIISFTGPDLWKKSVAFIEEQNRIEGETVFIKCEEKGRTIFLVGKMDHVNRLKTSLNSESVIWRRELAKETEAITEVVSCCTSKHFQLLQTFDQFHELKSTVAITLNEDLQQIKLEGLMMDVHKAKETVRLLMDNILEESISLPHGLWNYFRDGPGVANLDDCFRSQTLLAFVSQVEASETGIRILSVKEDVNAAKKLLKEQFVLKDVPPPTKMAKSYFRCRDIGNDIRLNTDGQFFTLGGFGQPDASEFFVAGYKEHVKCACVALEKLIMEKTDKEELILVEEGIKLDFLETYGKDYLSGVARCFDSAGITLMKGVSRPGILINAASADLMRCGEDVKVLLGRIVIERETISACGIESYSRGRSYKSDIQNIEKECKVVINIARVNSTSDSCLAGCSSKSFSAQSSSASHEQSAVGNSSISGQRVQTSTSESVSFMVCGLQAPSIKQAIGKLKKAVTNNCVSERVVEEIPVSFDQDRLKKIARQSNVTMALSPSGSDLKNSLIIQVSGEKNDVQNARLLFTEELLRASESQFTTISTRICNIIFK